MMFLQTSGAATGRTTPVCRGRGGENGAALAIGQIHIETIDISFLLQWLQCWGHHFLYQSFVAHYAWLQKGEN